MILLSRLIQHVHFERSESWIIFPSGTKVNAAHKQHDKGTSKRAFTTQALFFALAVSKHAVMPPDT